jgi:tetratricopeptide (TPR) repeat protein
MSEQGEWMLITMDEKRARRQGVPVQLPVRKSELDGIADKGMTLDQIRKWIRDFLAQAGRAPSWRNENAALAKSLEAFVGKTELLARAEQAFAKSDFVKAISTLRMVASVDPDDHATKMNLGLALANTGDNAGALVQLDAIRPTFTGEADYHLAVGQISFALGKTDRAADEFVLALEANPECKPAMDALVKLGVLVAVYEDARDPQSLVYVRSDGLLSVLGEAWSASPRDARFFIEQADYHLAERRAEVALAAADRAILAGGDDALVKRGRLARIAALRSLGRGADARSDVAAEIARAPGAAWAHVELARFAMDDGKHDEARAELDQALALDPSDQTALMLRFYPSDTEDKGKLAAAIPPLTEFAASHSDHAGPWQALARAKAALDADDEALPLFAKAIALAPEEDAFRAEYWAHLERLRRFDVILKDAESVPNMKERDWRLRFSEAEAFRGLGRKVEARAAFAAINFDAALSVEVRKRAKRAVMSLGDPTGDA